MAGELGLFVVGTDVVGGSNNGNPIAGGALPGTWGTTTTGIKPEMPQIARSDPTFSAVRTGA